MLLLFILCCIMFTRSAAAQSTVTALEVTFNKTSTVIFTSDIISVDRGSRDVLVQKVKGLKNALQLKAAYHHFPETNLTVITDDGILHHFSIQYTDTPETLTYQIAASKSIPETNSLHFQTTMTTTEMDKVAGRILKHGQRKTLHQEGHHQMKISLYGIYIKENVMFFHIGIANTSNIPFDTDILRFFIQDKKIMKRTAVQEIPEVPLHIHGNSKAIPEKSEQNLIIAIPRFTIPDAKRLVMECLEKRGGRHLTLRVRNNTIMKAIPVPHR